MKLRVTNKECGWQFEIECETFMRAAQCAASWMTTWRRPPLDAPNHDRLVAKARLVMNLFNNKGWEEYDGILCEILN